MKPQNYGFTLVELAISVAVTGIIVVSALGSYKYVIPKIQFSESLKMMDAEVPNVLSANLMSACTVTGANQTIKGKYGVLTVAGTFKKVSGQSCPAGCTLTYKFNSTDLSKNLAGKTVAANVTAGGQLSKTSATNVDALFVPGRFKAIATASGDSCTTLADGALTATTGTLTGTDKATSAVAPTNPLTPTDPSGTILPPPPPPPPPPPVVVPPPPPPPPPPPKVLDATFISGKYMQDANIGNYGYFISPYHQFGTMVKDDVNLNGVPLGLISCSILSVTLSNTVYFVVDFNNRSVIPFTKNIRVKLTNLDNGATLTTQPLEIVGMSIGWGIGLNAQDTVTIRKIFTTGQRVRMEVIEA